MSWVEGTGNVFDQLVTLETAITGTKRAFDTAIDGAADFPFWMNYPLAGEATGQSSGWLIGLHTVRCEVHVMRGSLPDNENEIRPFLRPFYKAVWNDPTLGGTVTAVNAVRYRFTAWEYSATEKHVGIEFEIDVKVTEDTA